MEPRIQYATTSDGVSIGYWTFGEGPALVQTASALWGISHTSWQLPEGRAWYERLARHHTLVRYDARGTGNSDRHADDYSQEGHIRDLEAVVDVLGVERVALLGYIFTGPAAMAYAVRHPERVSHLILWCSLRDWRVWQDSPRYQAFNSLRAMADSEWDLYVETMAGASYRWGSGDLQHRIAELMRASVSPAEVPAILEGQSTLGAAQFAADIRVPTLVIHRRDLDVIPLDEGRKLAASIPGAELIVVEGESASPFVGDEETVARAIEDFLGGGAAAAPTPAAGAVHTILFTDLASSTALTQRLGDAQAQELLRAHNVIVREALSAHGGSEIKHTGDGIMASFPTASGALECAVAIQRAVARQDDANLQVHVGLNAGEPVAEDEDLFGTAVQLARRICDEAQSGEILASNVVRELSAGKGFLFADRGAAALKGFEDPVRLYEVRWREEP